MNRDEFIKRQFAYTKAREAEHFDQVIRDDLAYKEALTKLYEDTAKDMLKTVESLYTRYALSEGVPIEEAKKRITKFDAAGFAEKAQKLVEAKDFSEEANRQLRLYNLKMRVSRLQMMEHEMRLETIGLADKEEKMLKERLQKAYAEEVERQADILGLRKGTREKILKRADRVINGDFRSARFSSRIWANQQDLQAKLERGLTRSLLRGENPKVWAREMRTLVRKNMADTGRENALYAANRLAITETSRVMNEARISALTEAGFNAYVWICEPGACHVCAPYDGEVFSLAKGNIGENVPPMHPFCKCSIAGFYEYDPDESIFQVVEDELMEKIQEDHDLVYDQLPEDERNVLTEYMLDGYIKINQQLNRPQEIDAKTKSRIEVLDATLDKFSTEESILVYRGAKREIYEGHGIGEIITEKGFLSTSVERRIAKTFPKATEEGKKVLFEIQVPRGKNGAYIGWNSPYGENEYILKRGSQFEIININKEENVPVYTLRMLKKEVEDGSKRDE